MIPSSAHHLLFYLSFIYPSIPCQFLPELFPPSHHSPSILSHIYPTLLGCVYIALSLRVTSWHDVRGSVPFLSVLEAQRPSASLAISPSCWYRNPHCLLHSGLLFKSRATVSPHGPWVQKTGREGDSGLPLGAPCLCALARLQPSLPGRMGTVQSGSHFQPC